LVRINRLNSFTGLTPRANPVEIICKQQQQSIFQTTKVTILVIVATPPPVTNVRLVVHEAKKNVYCQKIGWI
jgi:hypothetical protein